MSGVRVIEHDAIPTRDRFGERNGFLVPVYNAGEGFVATDQEPKQAYVTVVAPGCVKGPHLHMKRWGLFTCLKGTARIVVRTLGGAYEHYETGDDAGYRTIQVPAGMPAAIQNIGTEDAYVLNLPSPAWSEDDPDDHDVDFHDYEFVFD